MTLSLILLLTTTAHAAPPQFHLPIACMPGRTCFIQQYFDHDPGPGAKDYRCGPRVYDGHDGVDIRLPSIAAQRRGVAVLAAAEGVVTAVRDDVPDHLITSAQDRAAIAGRECGNGVLLTHADGWQSQYCHMARGSIAVTPGARVAAGAQLGLVGLSGDTQFPHVHFAIRQGTRKVDPFAPDAAPGGCTAADGATLWTPDAARALAYRSTEILNLGFADGPLDMDRIESETLGRPAIGSAALVGYGRAIGLEAGDRMRVAITDPTGAILIEREVAMDAAKAQYMLFAGKPRPAGGWRKGHYTLSVTVARGDQTVATEKETITF